MNFEQYYTILKESPDRVLFKIGDKDIALTWDIIKARPFGFINWDARCTLGDTKDPFFNNVDKTHEFMYGSPLETHGQMVKKFIKSLKTGYVYVLDSYNNKTIKLDLSNEDMVYDVFIDPLRYRLACTSHDIFMPCGRIWVGVSAKGEYVNLISFWRSDIEITESHITRVLDAANIEEDEWDSVYLDFSSDKEGGTRLTFAEFKNNSLKTNETQKKTKQGSETAHLAAGFGGAFKNKSGFGSDAEAQRSQKAGFGNTAEYKNARYPYGESKENN